MDDILNQFSSEMRAKIRHAVLAEIARKAGHSKKGKKEKFSALKRQTSRENGRKGGRPKGVKGYDPV